MYQIKIKGQEITICFQGREWRLWIKPPLQVEEIKEKLQEKLESYVKADSIFEVQRFSSHGVKDQLEELHRVMDSWTKTPDYAVPKAYVVRWVGALQKILKEVGGDF